MDKSSQQLCSLLTTWLSTQSELYSKKAALCKTVDKENYRQMAWAFAFVKEEFDDIVSGGMKLNL